MKTKKPAKKADRKGTEEALLPNMDYLHGDVVDGEYQAACEYEYARESKTLLWAARLHKKCPPESVEEIYLRTERRFGAGEWFINSPWINFFECPSFPTKSWNQLSDEERKEILHMGLFPLPANEVRPLRMNEVWLLNSMGVFDEFKAMAAKQMQEKWPSGPNPPKTVYPIIKGWPNQKEATDQWLHALFTIDFSKTKKRLMQEFGNWLDLSENKARLHSHKRNPIGKTGEYKDRLKDLAAWRLYRQLSCDKALDFANEHRKRVESGKPRKFHDPREGQSEKPPLNQSPLYSEESGFLKAEKRAKEHREKLIPWEFGIYAKEREKQEREFAERVRKIWRQAKISKSSS